MPLDPADPGELTAEILDELQAGRDSGEPWGYTTPAVMEMELKERGVDTPTRETIRTRLRDLTLAGYLENRHDKGLYVFVEDPREEG